jgi:DNA invertase Pin-like site-specific DNA recombinase
MMASAALSLRTGPGFLRLMNALKPRPPFQVLVMSEDSRLGRSNGTAMR